MRGFGSRLRSIREQRGLTQKALGKRIHKSTSAISGYETDFQMPPTDVLVSISKALHVSVSYLMDTSNQDTYSVSGLTEKQKEALDLIYREFTQKSSESDNLSPQQIEIIQKLIHIFSQKE